MASLLDVRLVDDWLARKDVLGVPGDDDQQILPSTCRWSHGVPEAGLPLSGEQVPPLELDTEGDIGGFVPAVGQQPHVREGLCRMHEPVTRPAVIGVPDLPDSMEGFDDMDFDRVARNGAGTEQFACVEIFDAGRGSEVDRESADRIPHIVDERSQIVPFAKCVSLRLCGVHRRGVTSAMATGRLRLRRRVAVSPATRSRGRVRRQTQSGPPLRQRPTRSTSHRTAPGSCHLRSRPP